MPEDSIISLPERTYGVILTFEDMGASTFDFELVLANGTHVNYSNFAGRQHL